jgi:two-component system, OmpR family, sensor histidine kinase BaeS
MSRIRSKLTISFFSVALVSLLTINLLVNFALSISFSNYLDNQRNLVLNAIVQELTSTYSQANDWSNTILMDLTHEALMQDIQFQLNNTSGKLVWDTYHMIKNTNVGDQYNTRYDTKTVPLIYNNKTIGYVTFYLTASLYHEHEAEFLSQFNIYSTLALLIVMIGVYAFATYISKGISSPLIRIKEVASKIQKGDLSQRVPIPDKRDEITDVGLTINTLAESLYEQEQLRRTLTSDIAHELRTPLATIQSHLEAFQDRIWEPTPEKIQICHDQVMRLVHLIKDLESLADAENPMIQLNKVPVDMGKLLFEAIRTVKVQWLDKTIDLNIEIPESKNVMVKGDPQRLLQVFVNLLQNAYKYTNDGGTVGIQLFDHIEYVEVNVWDTGIGIQPDDLPRIFERFYRGDKSRNRKTGGSGVGLAIVKAIVDAHGGSIHVSSTVGIGSRFTVRFKRFNNFS